MTVKPPKGDAYPATVVRDGDIVTWDVTDSDLLYEGAGEIQLAFVVNDVIAKSYIGHTRIQRSIIPTGEIPTPIEDWITQANELLDELEEAVPSGGTTGQVLKKKSDSDYDTEWSDDASGVQIDDTAGAGDTGVTWSANKSATGLSVKYEKPFGGIPATDMENSVQVSLGKADTAYQKPHRPHRTAIVRTVLSHLHQVWQHHLLHPFRWSRFYR